MRETDIIGRYGGDEFMIIMPDISGDDAKELGYKLLDAVRVINLNTINITFSCGIAKWEDESSDQLVEKADQMMYKSKRAGRNRVTA
jgi:diguanylate cyclase (GGDEF)-like protein